MSQQSAEPGRVEAQPRERAGPSWYAQHRVATAVGAAVGLLALAVIVFTVVAALTKSDVAAPTPTGPPAVVTPTATSPAPTSVPPTPTPTPTATPTSTVSTTTKPPTAKPTATPTPLPSVRYAGRGSGTFRIKKPQPGTPAIVSIYGSKTGGITVTAYDAAGRQRAVLVTGGVDYHGSVLLDAEGGDSARLRVRAPGFWSVVLKPILSAPRIQSIALTGRGDEVLDYLGDPALMKVAHSGSRTFTVTFYGATTKALVRTTGRYSGQVLVPGSGAIVIHADGGWAIGKA